MKRNLPFDEILALRHIPFADTYICHLPDCLKELNRKIGHIYGPSMSVIINHSARDYKVEHVLNSNSFNLRDQMVNMRFLNNLHAQIIDKKLDYECSRFGLSMPYFHDSLKASVYSYTFPIRFVDMDSNTVQCVVKRDTVLRRIVDGKKEYEAFIIIIQKVSDYYGDLMVSKPKFYDFNTTSQLLTYETKRLQLSIRKFLSKELRMTAYEKRIISLILNGFSYLEIAEELKTNPKALKATINVRFKKTKLLPLFEKSEITAREGLTLLKNLGLDLS